MTCTIGLVHDGVVYMGADSLGSTYNTKKVRNDKKVFHSKDLDQCVYGFAGSYRMGQLLMYAKGLLDSRDSKIIDHEYLVTRFVPNVRNLFKDQGFEKNNSGEAEGGVFLLGLRDKLYGIYSDYQVAESSYNYIAMGSGELHAIGSLYTTQDSDLSPQERIVKALMSAQEFAVGVEAPFYIINTKTKETEVYDRNGNKIE